MVPVSSLAVVAIGRNEGDRLRACLTSLPDDARRIYVDSGSVDGSVAAARAAGAEVVLLPPGTPFTAALARNAGLARLDPADTPLVQMVDGDCALAPGWLAAARAALAADPGLAVVFGRRRERFPERSLFNRLCDDEWNVPVGEARSCGGDALFRLDALRAAGGYRDAMIAGEEPDLCLRLREAGWRIARLDAEMTLHDAAMTRFVQWWRRSVRAGHAFAELAWRNRGHGDPAWTRAVRSSLGWAAGVPLGILLAAWALGAPALLLALVYPVQAARLAFEERRHGWRFAWGKGLLLVVSRFSQTLGVAQFGWRRLTGATPRLIEYKEPAPVGS
jgi:GT2 family glycosyltransferase